jgi:glutathione gamma-glutamylcysteinyltransferase
MYLPSYNPLVCLAKCSGLDVLNEASNNSLEDFITDVTDTCQAGTSQAIIVNFSRAVLGQSGDGHFSPTGALCVEEGRKYILVLDTARFKYPSYWVDAELLYKSIRTVDDTGVERGWLKMRRSEAEIIQHEKVI